MYGLVFCRHTDETSLLPAIDNVKYPGGELKYVGLLSSNILITEIFNPAYGARWNALNAVIVITDGIANIDYATALLLSTGYEAASFTLFVVCVAPECTEKWAQGIASPPKRVRYTIIITFRSEH